MTSKLKEYRSPDTVAYCARSEVVDYLRRIIREGDVVVTMGAGDIVRIHDEIIRQIQERPVSEAAGINMILTIDSQKRTHFC